MPNMRRRMERIQRESAPSDRTPAEFVEAMASIHATATAAVKEHALVWGACDKVTPARRSAFVARLAAKRRAAKGRVVV